MIPVFQTSSSGMVMRTRYALLCLGLCGALYAAGSNATGVSQYRYDALGRLTQACTTTAASGARTDYTHDKADNRQNVRSQSTTVSLPAGSNLYSPNGQYFLAMQGDGNFGSMVRAAQSGAATPKDRVQPSLPSRVMEIWLSMAPRARSGIPPHTEAIAHPLQSRTMATSLYIRLLAPRSGRQTP